MKKIAVILSGCGVYDGAEIHEATLTLLALSNKGAEYKIFAPDIAQAHVINHITGMEMDESRNVLVESARIARGDIQPLSELQVDDFDGIIFPGGFGAAKNLCSFAFEGIDCKVNPEVEKVITDMNFAGKPIGALCISPALITKVLGGGIEVTIGQDQGTADAISLMGGKHIQSTQGGVVVDLKNKIVTTPCYMLDSNISQIYDGAENLVKEVLKLA